MNNPRIYFVVSGNAIRDSFLIDKCDFDVEIKAPYEFSSRLLSRLFYLWCRDSMSLLRKCVSRNVWKKHFILNDNNCEKSSIYIFMPGNKIDRSIDPEIVDEYKSYSDSKLVLLMFDSMDSLSPSTRKVAERLFKSFDLVMTFDRIDSERYHIEYFNLPYDRRTYDELHRTGSDLFFVGHDKGRSKILKTICQTAAKKGLECDFTVLMKKKICIGKHGGISFTRRYTRYADVIKKIEKTNCLLDIACKGQSAASLRYCEAVAYNKKLLSNNPEICKMPFYNERFMRTFQDPETIDYEWIKKRESVDYNYDDSFNWNMLLHRIVKELQHHKQ